MDYKKAYEEALERAKRFLEEENYTEMADVFPELRESEDEKIRNKIIDYLSNELHNVKQLTPRTNEVEAWIAYLEEQKPAEWSEEDEKMRQSILNLISITFSKTYRKEINWLKSLPLDLKKKNEDVAKLYSNEWSEEDERIRQKLIRFISSPNVAALMLADDKRMFVSWLKALRSMPKVAVADGTLWKPSEEQMDSLDTGINALEVEGYDETAREIKDIYEQLKKLMEG